MALQKSYSPSKDNIQIKRVVKSKGDILVEKDTVESQEKLKDSAEIREEFDVQEVTRNKPKMIIYDVSNTFSERQVTKLIFKKNEIDMIKNGNGMDLIP